MTTIAALDPPVVDASPGTEAIVALEVRNTGSIVESYQLTPLGEAAAWIALQPSAVSLLPGDSARITVIIRPGRSGRLPAGDVPYAIRVTPASRPDAGAVPEGVIRLHPLSDTSAEMRPRTSKGMRTARHEVAVDNRGNVPVTVEIVGADADDALTVRARPTVLTVGPNQAAFAAVNLKHRRALWKGQPVTRQFQVRVLPRDAPPIILDGSTVQEPMLARSLSRIVAALLALALLGAGLWFGLLRPAVDSAAKDALDKQNAAQRANAGGGAGGQAEPDTTAGVAPEVSVAPTTPAGAPPTGATPVPKPAPGPTNTLYRHTFQVSVGAGQTALATRITAPRNATIVLTDAIIQNPQGDVGRLDLLADNSEFFFSALQNYRDLDHHFVSPIEIAPGHTATMRIRCTEPGDPIAPFTSRACRDWVLVTGYLRPNPA